MVFLARVRIPGPGPVRVRGVRELRVRVRVQVRVVPKGITSLKNTPSIMKRYCYKTIHHTHRVANGWGGRGALTTLSQAAHVSPVDERHHTKAPMKFGPEEFWRYSAAAALSLATHTADGGAYEAQSSKCCSGFACSIINRHVCLYTSVYTTLSVMHIHKHIVMYSFSCICLYSYSNYIYV